MLLSLNLFLLYSSVSAKAAMAARPSFRSAYHRHSQHAHARLLEAIAGGVTKALVL